MGAPLNHDKTKSSGWRKANLFLLFLPCHRICHHISRRLSLAQHQPPADQAGPDRRPAESRVSRSSAYPRPSPLAASCRPCASAATQRRLSGVILRFPVPPLRLARAVMPWERTPTRASAKWPSGGRYVVLWACGRITDPTALPLLALPRTHEVLDGLLEFCGRLFVHERPGRDDAHSR